MVRWMLGLGCLGAGALLALEALYTIKTQKKKRKKKKERKKGWDLFLFVFCFGFFLHYLVLVLNCKQGLQKYLSFILSERVFLKSLLGFIFLFLFTFCFCLGNSLRVFFSFSPPLFFWFVYLFCFVTKRLVNQMFSSPYFLQTMQLGSAALQLIPFPKSHNFSWELSSRQSIFSQKKSGKKTQWLQTRLLLSISFLV